MDDLYSNTLNWMDVALTELMRHVPPARLIETSGGYQYRFTEQSVEQAMIQKLARIVSGLRAARLLLDSGFLQEQSAICRLLDEFTEDVVFLSFASLDRSLSSLHEQFLTAFYAEEFEVGKSAIESDQSRNLVPRRKIHAYITNRKEQGVNPSDGIAIASTISKAYSGYVHGASPQTMEMYESNPPRFLTHGMLQSVFKNDHQHDIWNHFYRGICSFGFAAKAIGGDEACAQVMKFLQT
ncbi:MAG: hypothetical protein WBN04_07035, partial [Paracoccaceae bacterium]